MKSRSLVSATSLCVVLAAGGAFAQTWTSAYTSSTATGDCSELPAALNDTTLFQIQPIISRTLFTNPQPARITKLAFWLNPQTHKADIFVGERGNSSTSSPSPARILYYNASATPSPTLTVIGEFPQAFTNFSEAGVWGLAVNPQTFHEDHFLYVIYASGSAAVASATTGWRVSRFKTDPTTRVMDMNSEKILMHIPAGNADRWHTGTSMRFDNFGNLYIGMGDNEATAMGPANTADLRGGILRIKPDNSEKGYSIPAGNFGEYWADVWEDSGWNDRASAYRDTAIVKAEIYVKGSRNPYSFGVDPHRPGWVAWAECGPDRGGERGEEHNFSTTPAFSGWPFWVGNGIRQSGYASGYDEPNEPKTTTEWNAFNPSSMSPDVPVNNWMPIGGYDTLPPMHVPYHVVTSGCAMGGPIVRYDGRINNPDKLPPHLDNVIISSTQSGTTTWHAIKIDTTTGTTPGAATSVFTMAKTSGQPSLRNSSETVQGPDGVLYVVDQSENCCGSRGLNNTEGVAKLIYKGTCRDPGLVPVSIAAGQQVSRRAADQWLRVGATSFSITAPGVHEAAIVDVNGRTVHTFRGDGHKTYSLPTLGTGVHVLRVKTTQGFVARPLSAGL